MSAALTVILPHFKIVYIYVIELHVFTMVHWRTDRRNACDIREQSPALFQTLDASEWYHKEYHTERLSEQWCILDFIFRLSSDLCILMSQNKMISCFWSSNKVSKVALRREIDEDCGRLFFHSNKTTKISTFQSELKRNREALQKSLVLF